MWKKVEYPQAQSITARTRARAQRHRTPGTLDGEADCGSHVLSSSTPSASSISRIVKELRRTATALPQATATSVGTVLVPTVLAFINRAKAHAEAVMAGATLSAPPLGCVPPRLTLVGLGVGEFDRRESRSGFLQMACFVALKQLCERHWKSDRVPATDQPTVWLVETLFYEPLATPLHKACCEKLGILVEETNRFGRYSPTAAGTDFVVLFMPHCPWVLVHNTFAANWPAVLADRTDSTPNPAPHRHADPPLAIQRVLWIANDLRETPLAPASTLTTLGRPGHSSTRKPAGGARRLCVYSEELISCLAFASVGADKVHSKRAKRSRKSHRAQPMVTDDAAGDPELADSVAFGEFSAHDVHEALSELAVMHVKAELEQEAVIAALTRYAAKPPPIFEVTMEL